MGKTSQLIENIYILFHVTDRNECLSAPCLNNGTCVNTQGSFKCLCPPGYEGEFCQTSMFYMQHIMQKGA